MNYMHRQCIRAYINTCSLNLSEMNVLYWFYYHNWSYFFIAFDISKLVESLLKSSIIAMMRCSGGKGIDTFALAINWA